MEDFYRIRRLPPYVFEVVNRANAAARNVGADISGPHIRRVLAAYVDSFERILGAPSGSLSVN